MNEVEQLLVDKKIHFVPKGKDLLVHCLNPEHDDTRPSMRIDREDGLFHCFGCGYKGNVFLRFNRYRNVFNSKVRAIKESIMEIRRASWSGFEIPQDAFFVSVDFRGIPGAVIEKFQGFQTSELGMEDRLVFPITDAREVIIGYQGRYINTSATPKYRMYPEEVSLGWYPSANKIVMTNGTIILVEGLLDAFYLHGKGLENAVTTFGTKSVKFDNIEDLLMPYMLAGLQKVFLLMDGDAAGRSANEHIKNCIEQKTDLLVEIISLQDGIDPATMPDKEINMIKNLLKYS